MCGLHMTEHIVYLEIKILSVHHLYLYSVLSIHEYLWGRIHVCEHVSK